MAYKKGRCLKRAKGGGRCLKRAKTRRRTVGKRSAAKRSRARYRRVARRRVRKAPGMARRGSHCRGGSRVYSRALRKRVWRCTRGYGR